MKRAAHNEPALAMRISGTYGSGKSLTMVSRLLHAEKVAQAADGGVTATNDLPRPPGRQAEHGQRRY